MANKIYAAPETAITFKESGGTVTFTPKSVNTGNGRISAQWDRGAGSKPMRYRWRAVTKSSSAYTIGNALEIYLATSNGTSVDGNQGTADAAFATADKRRNLQPVGSVIADLSTANEPMIASGVVEIFDRYVSVVWWNALGVQLTSTAGDHYFELTPVPDEVQ